MDWSEEHLGEFPDTENIAPHPSHPDPAIYEVCSPSPENWFVYIFSSSEITSGKTKVFLSSFQAPAAPGLSSCYLGHSQGLESCKGPTGYYCHSHTSHCKTLRLLMASSVLAVIWVNTTGPSLTLDTPHIWLTRLTPGPVMSLSKTVSVTTVTTHRHYRTGVQLPAQSCCSKLSASPPHLILLSPTCVSTPLSGPSLSLTGGWRGWGKMALGKTDQTYNQS